jgi:ankyrin repeat protein
MEADGMGQRVNESDSMSTNSSTNQEFHWYIHDYPYVIKDPDHNNQSSVKNDDVTILRLKNGIGCQLVGFRPSSGGFSQSKPDALDKRCADSAVDWIRHNEMNEDNPGRLHPNHAARIVHFRSRLAYLTTYPITPHGQEWDTDIRNMAESLQEALQDSANYIFSGVMKLSEGWKDASALVWSTTCQLSDPSMKSPHFPIHFLMYRNNKRWEISKYHLEAALGLWMWSLKLLPNDIQPFARKTMLAKEGLEKELESAIRLWVTQADMINDRIELLSPPSTNSSEHQWIPASISGESYYPTCLSVSVTTLLGPLELMEGNTEDKSHTRVLATQTRSSPLQMIAQDIFTIFISRIADIMEPLRDAIPRQNQLLTTQSLTNSEDRPYLGLMNAHIEIIIDRVVAVGIGSRQDVLMSIIPPLLSRCKLPPFDNLMDDLLFHSRSLRRDSRFQVGKDLLTGLLHSGPPKFHERVVRSLWELYRAAIRSPNQQDKDFGARGLVNFAKTCNGTGLSDLAKLAVGDYQQWGEMFIKLYNEKDHYKRKIDSETEFLDDLGRKEARPHGLTLTTEFDLSNAPLGLVLGILRWAILKNCPELVEDLWNINREVIHESYNDLGWSSIFWAIETGCDADTFLSLLESPTIRPDLYDKNGQTPLLVAAQKGHYEAVSLLLKRGVDKMAKDIDDRTALSLASENGHYEIVERLLLENAEVNAHDRLYGSALAAAAHRCHTKIVKFLVEEGKADVNKQLQSEYYNSALEAATKQRRTEIVKFLVQVGKADPNIPLANGTNGSVLEVAVYCGDSDIVKFLVLEGKADVNMQPEGGDYGSALAAAAYWGNTEIVKFLVQEGQADVNMVLQNGNHGSALAAAAYRENTEIVEFLVQEGQADVNMQSQSGHYGSPLAAAAYWGNTEIVKFLVQKGSADVNMNLQSGEYGSALAAAAYGRRIDIVRFLVLEESADVNLQLQKGDYGSALVAAVNGANISIVKFLVLEGKADANMNLLCGKYGSALAVAAYIGESRIVQFLVLEGNADVNMHLQRGIYGSALEAAVSGIDTDIMKYLVQEGRADVNMQLQRGNYGSALATAASKGRTDVVKYLVQEGQADVNMQIQRGNYGSALAAAVSGGGIDDVKYLVREGQADVNMVLQSGRYGSALAVAAHSGRPPMVQFLVQEGKADVNVNLQSGDFGSAFAAAAHGGSTNIVQFLIQEGKADANMRLQSGDYGSALTAATYRGESSVVQFLVKEGKVNVNQNLNSGRYGGPLATAAYFGWKQCVEILIEVGMNVTLKLENGPFESVLHAAMADISPKHLNRLFVDPRDEDARRKEKEETVALLLNHGAAR